MLVLYVISIKFRIFSSFWKETLYWLAVSWYDEFLLKACRNAHTMGYYFPVTYGEYLIMIHAKTKTQLQTPKVYESIYVQQSEKANL